MTLALRGASPDDIAAAAQRSGWLPARAPDSCVDEDGEPADIARITDGTLASWGTHTLAHARGCTVLRGPFDPDLARLEALPFEVTVIESLFPAWRERGYVAPAFGELLPPLGWACAFRGAGHDRLVSRRWLPFGPWRLHERANDLSIVEFHDAAADADTALAQAMPGHTRMGISDEGGYLQRPFAHVAPPTGFLRGDVFEIVVHGALPTARQMLEACALRATGRARQVAYVFMEEHRARACLHELWLHGLEVRAMRLGTPVRLDDEYAPVPSPPAWAR